MRRISTTLPPQSVSPSLAPERVRTGWIGILGRKRKQLVPVFARSNSKNKQQQQQKACNKYSKNYLSVFATFSYTSMNLITTLFCSQSINSCDSFQFFIVSPIRGAPHQTEACFLFERIAGVKHLCELLDGYKGCDMFAFKLNFYVKYLMRKDTSLGLKRKALNINNTARTFKDAAIKQ